MTLRRCLEGCTRAGFEDEGRDHEPVGVWGLGGQEVGPPGGNAARRHLGFRSVRHMSGL